MKLTDITIEKLRNNELVDELPEFYELKDVIENSEGHKNDSVFNHTLLVLEAMEKLLEKVNLDEKIDNYSKKQLLFLAVLFHDIAKKETIVEEEGVTSCTGHEELGAEKAKIILDRLDLTEKEKDYVIKLIRYHGDMHRVVASEDLENEYNEFKKKHSDILLELLLFGLADNIGSQVKETLPEVFKFRVRFYENAIASI